MRDFIACSRLPLLFAAAIGAFAAAAFIVDAAKGAHALAYESTAAEAASVQANQNPLLAKWEGPYGGTPPFDRVQVVPLDGPGGRRRVDGRPDIARSAAWPPVRPHHHEGLVHRPVGTPTPDRMWARAAVVRHARDAGLQLVDVLELDDDPDRTRAVLSRLHAVATASSVAVLVTDGLDADLAQRLAHDLGLEHEAVPPRHRRSLID